MNNILIRLYIFISIGCVISCKSFIDIDPPNNQLVTETVYQTNETAISAMTSSYAKFVNEQTLPYNIAFFTGIYSDELKNNSSTSLIVQFYVNSLNSTTSLSANYWNTWYNQIYQVNSVYEGCESSKSISAPVRKQLMAEALFMRGLLHFYLLNLYGDIPIVTKTDYTANAKLTRSPADKVYLQIIADLTYASENLNVSYVGKNSIEAAPSTDRSRPNQAAAKALLARIYLYSGDYINAEKEATAVIGNSAYIMGTLANAFLRSSKEAIWQLQLPTPNTLTLNTLEGANFILTKKPATSSSANTATISTQLLNSFEAGDQRLTNWIGKFTDVSGTYNFPNKYKVQSSQTISEWSIPLRLAEQYLIRAEARARQGKLDEAKEDLKVIRNRAGLGVVTATDQPGVLSAVLRERRSELFAEWGHRWFDLKRFGQADAVMGIVTPLKGGSWAAYKKLWPIPNIEIENNRNLIQNDQYN